MTNDQLPMIFSDPLRDSAYRQIPRRGGVSPSNITLISTIFAQSGWQFVIFTRPRIGNPGNQRYKVCFRRLEAKSQAIN